MQVPLLEDQDQDSVRRSDRQEVQDDRGQKSITVNPGWPSAASKLSSVRFSTSFIKSSSFQASPLDNYTVVSTMILARSCLSVNFTTVQLCYLSGYANRHTGSAPAS